VLTDTQYIPADTIDRLRGQFLKSPQKKERQHKTLLKKHIHAFSQ
jgi:hypothetical protein